MMIISTHFIGSINGESVRERRGDQGFGWNPIFQLRASENPCRNDIYQKIKRLFAQKRNLTVQFILYV